MNKLISLKNFKCEIGPLALSVEQFVSTEMKSAIAFHFNNKNIWEKTFPNYVSAELRFLTVKNILKEIRIKYGNLGPEELDQQKIKEISKSLLLEFKKYK